MLEHIYEVQLFVQPRLREGNAWGAHERMRRWLLCVCMHMNVCVHAYMRGKPVHAIVVSILEAWKSGQVTGKVCVCICICMYTCVRVCVCNMEAWKGRQGAAKVSVWMCVCVCMYMCVDACVFVCACICVWVCVWVCMHVYVCGCVCVCMHVYVCGCIHVYVCECVWGGGYRICMYLCIDAPCNLVFKRPSK